MGKKWRERLIRYRQVEILQSSSSRDDFDQLLGDHSLASAVEGQGQLVNHLSCRREIQKITFNIIYL